MHSFMISEESIPISSGNVVGCITFIMAHEHPDVDQREHSHISSRTADHEHDYHSHTMYASVQQADELLKIDIQHHFFDIIISTMHVHLEYDKCLEIIAVSGPYNRVKILKDRLQKLKSVISVNLFIIDKDIKQNLEKK